MSEDFKLPLVRRPLPPTLDLVDPMSLRVWMTRLVSGEFATAGQILPRLRLVCATHVEEAVLLDLPDGPGWGAAVWRHLAARHDVLRSFRSGVVILPIDGKPTRCACAVEVVDPAVERWWAGFWPLPDVLDHDTEVSWLSREGFGYETLPPLVQTWLDPAGRHVGIDARPAPAPEGPKLLVNFAELAQSPPVELAGLARLADRLLRDRALLDLASRRPPLVMVLRGRTMERWHCDGPMPCGIDDLVRNVCGLGDQPDGVVVIDRGHLVGGAALRVSVERGGERLTRTYAASSTPRWRNPVRAALGAHAWIGISPEVDLGLQPDTHPGFAAVGGADFH